MGKSTLNTYSVPINKTLVTEFMTENFTESKFDIKHINKVKSQLNRFVFSKSNVSNKTFKNKSITKDQ